MIVALVLSLGMIVCNSPGLSSPACRHDTRPQVFPLGWDISAQVHSTTNHGIPSSSTREALTEAESEEEEDEQLVASDVLSRASILNRLVRGGGLDSRATASFAGAGLLAQLHHCWQLLC